KAHQNKPVKERSLVGHHNVVEFVKYHTNDPNLLVSGSDDKTLKLWDIRSQKYAHSYAAA
ncbi:MAG: hypothetical protein MHPSP_004729, partial [Paramarteilia canceri]